MRESLIVFSRKGGWIFFFKKKCFLLLRAWLCKNSGVLNSTQGVKWANVLHYFLWSLHSLKTSCCLFFIVVFKGQESATKTCKYVANPIVPSWRGRTLGWELSIFLYDFIVRGLSVPVTCVVERKCELLQAVVEKKVSQMSSLKHWVFLYEIPGWWGVLLFFPLP